MGAWYTTREAVMASPDIRASAYASRRIDAAIEAGARSVDRLCHVADDGFAPTVATRSFPYPNSQHATTGRLYLDKHRLTSLTSASSGGVTIATANINLEPVNSGPPYSYIELNRATSSAFSAGSGTGQRSIVLAGVWSSAPPVETTAGTLSGTINASVTTMGVNFAAGVGDILRIDSERVIVTEKTWIASGQTGTLTSAMNAQTLAVSDGTAFAVDEELLLDAERVVVRDIAGNNLIVQRAWSGSVLADHSGVAIYWPRTLTVQRAALGTTAASHTTGASAYRHVPPGPVSQLNMAYALDSFFQQGAGYARTVGSGDSERATSGRQIKTLEEQVYGNYGRMARFRSV